MYLTAGPADQAGKMSTSQSRSPRISRMLNEYQGQLQSTTQSANRTSSASRAEFAACRYQKFTLLF